MKHKRIYLPFSFLVILALACNLPSAPQTEPPPGGDADLIATQTSLALTQAALEGSPTLPSPDPEITPTITSTPTITPTGTPTVPMVSVSVDTNCRTGPGVVYDYLTALLVGEKAQVIGKYTSVSPSYWIIKKGATTCWLWGQYATVEGDLSGIPEMVPPPSPTPPPTSTPTTPAAAGDLRIIEIFMSTGFEVIARVGTTPAGSLSGNFQYKVYSGGSKVAQGTCPVPTGSNACWTGYIVTGVENIRVEIDSNNAIPETNEGNNSDTVTCDKFGFVCN
ncbi:MAG: hypothetical protein Kow002_12350 [Anaerolineales bacterium]